MTNEKKEFNPWPQYFSIIAGLGLVGVTIYRNMEDEWSGIDFLKLGVGIALTGFGIFKLVKKK